IPLPDQESLTSALPVSPCSQLARPKPMSPYHQLHPLLLVGVIENERTQDRANIGPVRCSRRSYARFMRIWSKRTGVVAALAALLLGLALVATGGAAGAQGAATGSPPPSPDPYRGSVLYPGRGKGIKKVSFRLKGHKLIEARIAFFERCTTRGRGQGRRYRLRQEFEEA